MNTTKKGPVSFIKSLTDPGKPPYLQAVERGSQRLERVAGAFDPILGAVRLAFPLHPGPLFPFLHPLQDDCLFCGQKCVRISI